MVVVNIEIWPLGDEKRKRSIGHIVISNNGTGTRKKGNYNVSLSHSGIYYGRKKDPWKTGKVENHNRLLSPYHLVYKAIASCLRLQKET